MPDMVTYITYGKKEFNINEFYKVRATFGPRCKPPYGLWASRIDAEWGWKDWCESEGYGDLSCNFTFHLSPNAKIKEVHCEDDIVDYVIPVDKIRHPFCDMKTYILDGINFTKLESEGYDGLELFLSDDYSMHDAIFNTWDCDSIVIWNPDIIIPETGGS